MESDACCRYVFDGPARLQDIEVTNFDLDWPGVDGTGCVVANELGLVLTTFSLRRHYLVLLFLCAICYGKELMSLLRWPALRVPRKSGRALMAAKVLSRSRLRSLGDGVSGAVRSEATQAG